MNWRNINLIFQREVLDQLRDRRTLFMVAVLPVLLYPLLGIGTAQMTALFTEQPRVVIVLGANDLPPESLLAGDRFSSRWFTSSADQEKLHVVSDLITSQVDAKPPRISLNDDHQKRLEQARQLRDLIVERKQLEKKRAEGPARTDTHETAKLETRLQEIQTQSDALFAQSEIQVLVNFPANFLLHLEHRQERLTQRTSPKGEQEQKELHCDIVQNSADEKSAITFRRVLNVMQAWERSIVEAQLRESQLPLNLTSPLDLRETDLADKSHVSASVWSKIFPALLVMMALTGAFYPAVDLCAGEKERGTMETLLISPARRTEIVLGKFLTVLLFSMTTAVLNLASIGMTGTYMASLTLEGASSRLGNLTLPPLSSLVWVIVVLIPIATLFSALCLSLATFARSSKEGQYYLTPLLMVTLGLTMFCISPGTEMQPFFSILPVVGPGLLLKALMKAQGPDTETYLYAIPVLVTSVGYSLLALWWAIEQFRSEEILFGEAEQFSLERWLRQLIRDKGPVPSFAQALLCLVLMLLLQFASWKLIQMAILRTPVSDQAFFQIQILIIQQVTLIAGPPLLLGACLTSSLRETFSLRWPGPIRIFLAAVLAVTLHPLTLELMAHTQWFFPPAPPGVVELMQQLKGTNLGLALLAMAVTPAICEELAFRGFLLSGFRGRHRVTVAIILSSFAFGVIHMIPQQVFNASMLGLILGAICVRTRSLYPGIAFHFVYNSLGVLHDRWGARIPTEGPWGFLFRWEDQLLRYQPALVCLLIPVAVCLLYALTSQVRFRYRDLQYKDF